MQTHPCSSAGVANTRAKRTVLMFSACSLISAGLATLTLLFSCPAAQAAPQAEETWFPLNEAKNLAAVESRFGSFSPAQKAFLEKHRFLLVPRLTLHHGMGHDMDEMLEAFDAIPIREDEKPGVQDLAGARLFNPDIFQHGLHMYFYRRMRSLEEHDLAPALEQILAALVEEGLKKGASATEKLTAAELLTPYLLLKPALVRGELRIGEDGMPKPDPGNDSLKTSLAALEPYRARLGQELTQAVTTELKRIYAANSTAPCSFPGWISPYMAQMVAEPNTKFELDYTAFKPRGYYVNSGPLRGWFRAMIWLGQTGFDLKNDTGLATATAFASLLNRAKSAPAGLTNANEGHEVPKLKPREAMARIMRISAIFHGLPDTATPEEWLPFLERTLGKAPDSKTADDPAMLSRIKEALPHLQAGNRAFVGIRKEIPTRALSLFPSRFTLPWYIADELTWKEGAAKNTLPVRFSALWVPVVLGNETAKGFLPRQLQKTLAKCVDVNAHLAPQNCAPLKESDPLVTQARAALDREMAAVSGQLGRVALADWDGSLAAGRLKLLTTLNARFGKGYPLYMQDALFGRKQLESLLGAYTELKYDTVLYEKPQYAEMGDGGMEETIAPLSFVEPNLPFWQELQRQVQLIERIFRDNRLFPNDLEEYGALTQFKDAVNLCATVAQKELAGQRPSAKEIDLLHGLTLAGVAAPVDGQQITGEQEWWSGLIVDVQTVPDGPWTSHTYEALGVPYYMFALVGSGADKRVVTGLAYNHFEFTGPFGERLNDDNWKPKAYSGVSANNGESGPGPHPTAHPQGLPQKNFWYEGLLP